ncbi:MAG: adenylosuccinate synthase [Chitinophagaceae bacterium]|nr:adenylosuccinate synthase [Chitinophagaceae bacterium]
MVDVILGLQWGDEGKGKIVDFFAKRYDIVARFQGGPNAGHTLYKNGKKVVLHQIPSGVFHEGVKNLIGNGVVLDPVVLKKESDSVSSFGVDLKKNLFISQRAHLILPTHRALDKAAEMSKGNQKIGSTLKGIAPAYMDKTGRNGLRVGDLLDKNFTTSYIRLRLKHQRLLDNYNFSEDISAWEEEFFEAIEFLRQLNIVSGEYFINQEIRSGKKVLAEGAQGSMLDIDFGTFPYVTSSNTISAGVCSGLGLSPHYIQNVWGVTKAYTTRVGSGPFPTELDDESGEILREKGNEFGATTGRPRRCGWIDLVALKYACMINGVTSLIMTKSDVLDSFQELKVCIAYQIKDSQVSEVPFHINQSELKPVYQQFPGWNCSTSGLRHYSEFPENLRSYINFINDYLSIRIRYLSNGPEREQIIEISA